jgi:hypothetical protein
MTDARMVDHNDKECGLPMTSFVTLRIKILLQYAEYAVSKTQKITLMIYWLVSPHFVIQRESMPSHRPLLTHLNTELGESEWPVRVFFSRLRKKSFCRPCERSEAISVLTKSITSRLPRREKRSSQ